MEWKMENPIHSLREMSLVLLQLVYGLQIKSKPVV